MINHVGGFMSFRSNHQCYGLNHDIVCDNVPILHTHTCILGWLTMLQEEVFLFIARKSQFHRGSQKKVQYITKNPPMVQYIKGSIHYYTSLVSYIAYDRFLGRNHGASSLLNGIVGSVFTVKGGIS